MNKELIMKELAKLDIRSNDDLIRAISKGKGLDLSLMTGKAANSTHFRSVRKRGLRDVV